ncbi:hypothetical protein SAMN05216317_10591 [Nitrosomonas eutropha]|uniref:DUF2309 domain-containing protein n=1 Tax=Nitrosomonas eutropha TaxID=916 RepID=UPI000891960F|nr:DUF2309 domain-containing protein [Nitrosomonas eutropha]SCX07481.1 hypothetical protein SAMN05216379_10492 [Nitrosomonas eutropha]SDW39643.1 hypothetical protein SAMN05216317_10591 [Nitrosomonas eutropha]
MVDALNLGKILRVHATVYVAAEPVPLFWPMRTFIYNNPLHGLEGLPFTEAVQAARGLFHARVYLPRTTYQHYLREGKGDVRMLDAITAQFAQTAPSIDGIDWQRWLSAVRKAPTDASPYVPHASAEDVAAVLAGQAIPNDGAIAAGLDAAMLADLPPWRPLTECIDSLWGTNLAAELDELVVKSCLDFFDEDQSSWRMPGRKQGFYAAWADVARRNGRMFLRGLAIKRILDQAPRADAAIVHVMQSLGIAEEHWQAYFSRELLRLHGWAGFIRWRSGAEHYHWGRKHPADLVDFLAVRLVFALALIEESARHRKTPANRPAFDAFLREQRDCALLRYALHAGELLPGWAQRIDDALERSSGNRIARLAEDYAKEWRRVHAQRQGQILQKIAMEAGTPVQTLAALGAQGAAEVLEVLQRFAVQEGSMWLRALEARAIDHLLSQIVTPDEPAVPKRAFAQALFCIDVRSERLRRNLENVGDFLTFGIAGFFGVPVGFLGYGKGSETHLCPAIVTPKNLVLEISAAIDFDEEDFVSTLGHVLHDLKSSVISPFVTVEAIGALFGFDLIGKTMAPLAYHRWRSRLDAPHPFTHLLLDKLSREQADSIVRALQRAMIVNALRIELGIERERVNDDMIRELRETALGHCSGTTILVREFGLSLEREARFIEQVREVYRVNSSYANYQMLRLGRIGFSLDEQVNYVWTALTSIGLTRNFSRFVLLIGHGSHSENNPYESALDCGACGGSNGLVSARVLAQMANKAEVRAKLRTIGVDIPADTWFVPGLHTTTTDTVELYNLDFLPPRLLVYLERLRNGLYAASRLSAAERVPTLLPQAKTLKPAQAHRIVRVMSHDWSQVRPEWGLSGNLYFVVGRRGLTQKANLHGRSFLQSYDWQLDPKGRLLENILAGPVVVGQWINMEHYFSTVDNTHFGSGSKVYHNVAGRFGVMTGNLSDLRTGLPAQTVMRHGQPYHEPLRLIVMIEAPLDFARRAIEAVAKVKSLVQGQWVRTIILDPTQDMQAYVFDDGEWQVHFVSASQSTYTEEVVTA